MTVYMHTCIAINLLTPHDKRILLLNWEFVKNLTLFSCVIPNTVLKACPMVVLVFFHSFSGKNNDVYVLLQICNDNCVQQNIFD